MNNGDRLRSLTNEELAATLELAVMLMCPNEMGKADIDCDHSDGKNCCQCLLNWLNQKGD